MQVEALLDKARGEVPAVQWVVQQLEGLGYTSWAHRVVNSAGTAKHTLTYTHTHAHTSFTVFTSPAALVLLSTCA